MTAIHSLRLAAEKFPTDSEERKLLNWAEMQVSDFLDRIMELEEEVKLLEADKTRRVEALNATRNILNATSQMILQENFDLPADTLARDYAPFKNLMAHHGVEPYAKPKRVKKGSAA